MESREAGFVDVFFFCCFVFIFVRCGKIMKVNVLPSNMKFSTTKKKILSGVTRLIDKFWTADHQYLNANCYQYSCFD